MTSMWHIEMIETMLAWLAAYSIHSSVLLAAAWLGGRLLRERRLEFQEALWRFALIGGLVTATLQSVVGVRPIGGEIQLADLAHRSEVSSTLPIIVSNSQVDTVIPEHGGVLASGAVGGSEVPSVFQEASGEPWAGSGKIGNWSMLLLLMWVSGAVVAIFGLVRAWVRLKRLMRTGRGLPAGRFIRHLAASMGVRRPVALRVSPAFKTPFATGVWKLRICIPDFTVRELAPAEVENLLAHEMAHLARRDPAWIVCCRLLEGVFFFQPLNRVARRHLETLAECLCDDRAISCTGRPLDLARCLLQVAEKRTLSRRPLLVAAAVASRSRLVHRVERLLRPPANKKPCGPWVVVGLALCLLCATAVLPAISASVVDGSPLPAGLPVAFNGAVAGEETPEPPRPATHVGSVEEPAPPAEPVPPAEPAPPAAPEPVSQSEVEDLIMAERREMLAQLEAEVVASEEAQSSKLERTTDEDEAALAAATEAAMRAIEEHIAALEAETLDLEQAKDKIRDEMHALQREFLELNRERKISREEVERMRAEARRLAEERRPSREEIDRQRDELRDQHRELAEQERENRLLAVEEHRRDLEAARRAEFEEQRQMEKERRQAEQMARERAEYEEQEKQRDEQLARERAEQEQQENER